MFIRIAIITVGLFAFSGCDNTAAAADDATEPVNQTKTITQHSNDAPSGTKHDPALALDKVPDGDWYCDMGTSHYTQKSEGDGKCPVCGMSLKKMSHSKIEGAHKKAEGKHDEKGHKHEH